MRFSTLPYFLFSLVLLGCSSEKEYQSFGAKIEQQNALALNELGKLPAGETTNLKITGTVNEVCQAKGCWMTLKNESGDPVRVTFKDYGFFVPKDISGREVIVEGKVTKKVLEPDLARHYADDAGTEYDSTSQQIEYAFIAEGVLIATSDR